MGAQTATVQQQILSNPLEDGSLTSNGTEAIRNIDVINNFEAGPWRDTVEVNSSLAILMKLHGNQKGHYLRLVKMVNWMLLKLLQIIQIELA